MFSALRAGRALTSPKFPGTPFRDKPRAMVRLEGLSKLKKFNDLVDI
jgi:hypothetical protein